MQITDELTVLVKSKQGVQEQIYGLIEMCQHARIQDVRRGSKSGLVGIIGYNIFVYVAGLCVRAHQA